VGQRAVCHGRDEVDWHLTQTGIVKEGFDTLQQVIDYTLDGEMGWIDKDRHEEEIA
jgi:hypothetical protein